MTSLLFVSARLYLLYNLCAVAETGHQTSVGVDRDVVHCGGPEGRIEFQREGVQRVDGEEEAAETISSGGIISSCAPYMPYGTIK